MAGFPGHQSASSSVPIAKGVLNRHLDSIPLPGRTHLSAKLRRLRCLRSISRPQVHRLRLHALRADSRSHRKRPKTPSLVYGRMRSLRISSSTLNSPCGTIGANSSLFLPLSSLSKFFPSEQAWRGAVCVLWWFGLPGYGKEDEIMNSPGCVHGTSGQESETRG